MTAPASKEGREDIVDRLRSPDWIDPACPFCIGHCYCGADGEEPPHERVVTAIQTEAAAEIIRLRARLQTIRTDCAAREAAAVETAYRKGLEDAAGVVDQCNREGPYNAIASAARIRALDTQDSRTTHAGEKP